MKTYRVDFLLSHDFHETVSALDAEQAIKNATMLAEDYWRGEGHLDVVKVEEL